MPPTSARAHRMRTDPRRQPVLGERDCLDLSFCNANAGNRHYAAIFPAPHDDCLDLSFCNANNASAGSRHYSSVFSPPSDDEVTPAPAKNVGAMSLQLVVSGM